MVTAEAASPAQDRAGAGPITIDIHDTIAACAADWQAFERSAVTTLYQTHLWCDTWQATCGAALGARPQIAVIRGSDGVVLAILPLQIRRHRGVRLLEWLGTPQSAYGYGLFSAQALAGAEHWVPWVFPRILDMIDGFDAVMLTDMPGALFGTGHPLNPCFTLRSANLSFQMRLEADFETLHARKRNGEDRRAARRKEELLGQAGSVGFGLPKSLVDVHATLDQMFEHQLARMAELGVRGVATPAERRFLHRLADVQDEDRPILFPFRLTCGADILAVMLGGRHGGVFWALISSLTGGPLRKFSPGDLALRKTIKACCEAGFTTLDFSTGDSSYKRAWADTEIALFHHLSARTLRGLVYAAATGFRITVKRWVKTTPALFRFSLAVRRVLLGRRLVRR
jgi:CelD/BcsL family acetyltransferase involved in cellulose biosynthesis